MVLTSLRVYQLFLGIVSLVYAGLLLVSISGLMIGIVSVGIVPNQDSQFQSQATIMLCSIGTLPLACVGAIAGSWCLYFLRQYRPAWLPLLLPIVSIAIISLLVGQDISGVLGWN